MNQKVNFNECQNLLAFVYFKNYTFWFLCYVVDIIIKVRNCTDALFDHIIFSQNINDSIRFEQFILLSLK